MIVLVKEFEHPKIIKLTKSVYLRMKGTTNDKNSGIEGKERPLEVEDFDLELRVNRWTSPSHGIQIRGEDYVNFSWDISYTLVALVAFLLIFLGVCVGACCYCYCLYKRLMGIDRKPRLSDNSYVESIKSHSEETDEFGESEARYLQVLSNLQSNY